MESKCFFPHKRYELISIFQYAKAAVQHTKRLCKEKYICLDIHTIHPYNFGYGLHDARQYY